MTDPASIALHAIWKAGGIRIGQTGGVVGCGPIGLFAIQWMRLMGASEVIAVDVSEEKLALAKEAGATIAGASDWPARTSQTDFWLLLCSPATRPRWKFT